jgi:hypothetical protein
MGRVSRKQTSSIFLYGIPRLGTVVVFPDRLGTDAHMAIR